jgi:hypothetical protein
MNDILSLCTFRPLPALKPEIIHWFGWIILLKLKTRTGPIQAHPVLTFKRMLVVFFFSTETQSNEKEKSKPLLVKTLILTK